MLKKVEIKDGIKKIFCINKISAIGQRRELRKWIESDQTAPPPHYYKQREILFYARKFDLRILVETGTCYGEMVSAMKSEFDRIYSIELSQDLFKISQKRFDGYDHIELFLGNSAEVLPVVLEKTDKKPAIFWLDSHYSGGETAGKGLEVPIMKELNSILKLSNRGSVILVDDARMFTGKNGYPSSSQIEVHIQTSSQDWQMDVKNDIIRIYPNG